MNSLSPPLVSCVVSVFNDSERIRKSVQSLLDQTFENLDIIVVNDGSTDQTGDVLRELAARDSRIRVISQENAGLTKALIRGCAEARGEFIARQDSDDWSSPTRIEKQVQLLEREERIGFVSCFTEYVGPNDEPLTVLTRPADPEQATDRLLHHREGPPAHGSVMFRKSLYEQVGGYRPEFYYAQDSDLWLRMAEQSLIGYVDQVLYNHRRETGSISGAQRPVQAEFGRLCHEARQARLQGESEEAVLEQARSLRADVLARTQPGSAQTPHSLNVANLLGSQLVQNKDPRARNYLWTVLRSRPLHWKAWVRLMQSCLTSQRLKEAGHE